VLASFGPRPTGAAAAAQTMPTDEAIERLGTAAYLLM
jgi:hypothetical protein